MRNPAFSRSLFLTAVMLAARLGSANNLILPQCNQILEPAGGNGKHLAILKSFLMDSPVTVGAESENQHQEGISRGIQVWAECLEDNPFVLAARGEAPMVVVRFVDEIKSGVVTQGQVEFKRSVRWGKQTGYSLSATLLVKETTGQRMLTETEIAQIVAHELGHILGLADQDGCTGLMGYFVAGQPRLAPSDAELSALKEYRQRLRDSIARLQPARP